jgi:hypothetical protein
MHALSTSITTGIITNPSNITTTTFIPSPSPIHADDLTHHCHNTFREMMVEGGDGGGVGWEVGEVMEEVVVVLGVMVVMMEKEGVVGRERGGEGVRAGVGE